jgi:tetratricopeptide (TPR) repeat protein
MKPGLVFHRERCEKPNPVSFLLVVVFGCAVVGLQAVYERQGGPLATTEENLLYVRSPEAMQRLALSYDALLADLYWIRAVQHYGGTRLSQNPAARYDLLYPLLDLTTSLDPRFRLAYLLGSIFLAEPPPGGPGRTDLAIALLEKGLRAEPQQWEYAQAIGFVHYWWQEDYEEAAAWFTRAADIPGAPEWLRPLAATTLAQGGSRQSSRVLWQQIAQTAEIEWYRKEAQRRLHQLDAMDQLDELRAAVDVYRKARGAPPGDWADLRAGGDLRGTPVDPTGAPYRLAGGIVSLDPASSLNPLPTGPAQLR